MAALDAVPTGVPVQWLVGKITAISTVHALRRDSATREAHPFANAGTPILPWEPVRNTWLQAAAAAKSSMSSVIC